MKLIPENTDERFWGRVDQATRFAYTALQCTARYMAASTLTRMWYRVTSH